jgi:predicted patatin/cPLA2 family phospholipase
MQEKNKTAIVMAGGGMRSAHGAGFLYALATKLQITSPDILVATSGNAGNALYYAAKQYESGKKVWGGLLSTVDFISFRHFHPTMDVDYLVDTVFKKQEPLDTQSLAQSPIQWFIAVTELDTSKTRYLTAADHLDPFEILRAAKAIPVFFGKSVKLLGKNYSDGEFGSTLEEQVAKAIEQGANRIVVINNVPPHDFVTRWLMKLYAKRQPPGLRRALLHDLYTESVCMTIPGASIVCVFPKKLPARVATRDKAKLIATFDRGYADALALEKELRILFPTP